MSAPHDRPTMTELVAAVREFVERDVMAATEGRVQFHARVAANVLGIVARELELGGQHARAHTDALSRLGVGDEAELAEAIRRGALDDRYDDVVEVVRATVRAKLEVANPGYLE